MARRLFLVFLCAGSIYASQSDTHVYLVNPGEIDDFETNVTQHNPARYRAFETFALTTRARLPYRRLEASGINKVTPTVQLNFFDSWFNNLGFFAGAGYALLQNNSQNVTEGANNYSLALSARLLPFLRVGAGARLAFGLGSNADNSDGSFRARGGAILGPENEKWQLGYTTHFYSDIADFNYYLAKYDVNQRHDYDTDMAANSFLHKFSFRFKHSEKWRSNLLLSTYLQTQDYDFFISSSYFLQYQGKLGWHTGIRFTRKRIKASFSDDDTTVNWLAGINLRPFHLVEFKAGLSIASYDDNLLGNANSQVRSTTFLFLGSSPTLALRLHFSENLNLDMNLNEQLARVNDVGSNTTEVVLTAQLNYRLQDSSGTRALFDL